MVKLFTLMVALLLLAGCGDGGEEKLLTGNPDTKFKMQVQGLESDDMTARRNAFDYLASQGDKGLNAIKDFCKRHSDNDWGEEGLGFRCRISTDPILYYEAGGFEPDFKGNVIRGDIKVELKNVSPNTISIFTIDGNILANALHGTGIETCVGKKPEDWGLLIDPIVPDRLVQIESGDTISGYDPICNYVLSTLPEKVVCFRYYLSMEKGIYYITYDYCISLGPKYSGPSFIHSNRICFALLPLKKK